MLEIIISLLLSIGVITDGSDIKIISDTSTPSGTEQVTFYDNSNGSTYSMIGTEQNGWGITGGTASTSTIGTEQNGWGVK